MIRLLKKRGKVASKPCDGIEVPNLSMRKRRRFLLPEEAKKLLDKCENKELKFAIFCALHAGMRKLEVIEARSSWFDMDAKLIHIQATDTFQPKDRDCRTVPMTDALHRYLQTVDLSHEYAFAPTAVRGRAIGTTFEKHSMV